MKTIKAILLTIVSIYWLGLNVKAQGINFEKGKTWEEIKQKAKTENKYIFMDCYASWCGPCKEMDQNVYTQKKVGDFFNSNFISVKVQMDQTKQDDPAIKSWYSDAKKLEVQYKIKAFPSFLFFDPNGLAVHHFVGGKTPDELIQGAKAAFDANSQYFTLIGTWKDHLRDSLKLIHAFSAAKAAGDQENSAKIADAYVSCLKNPFTKENLVVISNTISNSEDKAFSLFLNHSTKIDSVMGNQGLTRNYLSKIIYSEEIRPRIAGKSTDWKVLSKIVKGKYPQLNLWNKPSDSVFLLFAFNSASGIEKKVIGEAYLNQCTSLFNKENIKMMFDCAQTVNDRYFNVLINNKSRINTIYGNGVAEQRIFDRIWNSEIWPKFDSLSVISYNTILKGVAEKYKILNVDFSRLLMLRFIERVSFEIDEKLAASNDSVDWKNIEGFLTKRFPNYDCSQSYYERKSEYYKGKLKWDSCENAAYRLLIDKGQKMLNFKDPYTDFKINEIAWGCIFENGVDKAALEAAGKIMKLLLNKHEVPDVNWLDTYANILYKLGNKDEAIAYETKAMDLLMQMQKVNPEDRLVKRNIPIFLETLQRMKDGKKTWGDDLRL